jgi:thioredoxin 1
MKKTLIALICFATLGIVTTSATLEKVSISTKDTTEQGIQFTEGSFNDILKKAKKEKKNIFLDAYASWCGPCKMLKRDVFPQAQVGEFFNKNFINVAMDMEKGEGIQLSQKFKITAYPTLLFINDKGEVIGSALGYHNADKLIQVARPFIK